jgi:molybdate transport system substrate-binding protein
VKWVVQTVEPWRPLFVLVSRLQLHSAWIVFMICFFIPRVYGSSPARVAVASNFVSLAKKLAANFEESSAFKVDIISGSSGKIVAQILQEAPYDAFLSADSERPKLLEEQGKIVAGSRFTYAVGQLALWSPRLNLDSKAKVLSEGAFANLALANPKLAPYGAAAQSTLEKMGLWAQLQSKIVYGQNISQAFQFVYSGQAEIGFVALSQLKEPENPRVGTYWIVPQEYHEPIAQQAVLLSSHEGAQKFLAYLKSDEVRAIIQKFGYDAHE